MINGGSEISKPNIFFNKCCRIICFFFVKFSKICLKISNKNIPVPVAKSKIVIFLSSAIPFSIEKSVFKIVSVAEIINFTISFGV